MEKESLERIAKIIVNSCFSVHKEMGPGLLESIYELCLIKVLNLHGLEVKSQVSIPLFY